MTTAAETNQALLGEIEKYLSGGGTFGEIYDLSSETIETFYQVGYGLYQGGSYADAEKVFRFLCLFDHYGLRHFIALGSCLQMQKEYQLAIESYSYAGLLDGKDPRSPYHAAECYLALGQREKASSGFYAASQLSEKHSKFDELCNKAATIYQQLNASLQETKNESYESAE
ncbi:SycD/LcrH family type III secretion system chaperone [Photobacterium chitinilyticum]|uniref:CesD/SycD/LcrH family type III secretion system chaperone n=1 Tax=Photobacterium chitinilyticum TaxID=2485123 RepID=A0A444JNI8_9GAMM|nr:SycD/LcrH family type III secretion system chaperone [Photobacterium chitinilyticum]RWX54498.1 CesD/SycD/LcrH family type III secretion system chaperone [Photobacterium chitinilyticum]